MEALRDKLRDGIPELDVPGIDPFQIDVVTLLDLPNFKARALNVTVTGLSQFEVENLHIDLEKMEITIHNKFKHLKMTGTYDIATRILVPVAGTGPVTITADNFKATTVLTSKFYNRGGKKYIYFSSLKTHIMVDDFDAQLGLDSGNIALQQAINQVLSTSHKELLEATTPILEKHSADRSLELANRICRHFTYDELFPDRE